MREVFLVKPGEADIARRIEAKLIHSPLSSGILFVGVSVLPATADGRPTYLVWIGCHRNFDEKLFDPMVRVLLDEELKTGINIVVQAHRGFSRSSMKNC